MKRHALALIVHPYKNSLIAEESLRQAVNRFFQRLLEIASVYPSLRLNLVLPGYMLTLADPMLLTQLREIHKRDCLEWLSPGFTEPFLSFSPQWLTSANLRAGQEVFEELLSARPVGYAPAFSNWEPSSIDSLRENGMQYVLISRAIIPPEAQGLYGYWITEHAGSSIPLFSSCVLHHYTAPANIHDWIEGMMKNDNCDEAATRLVAMDYLVPLMPDEDIDPYLWLESLAKALDSLLHKYQIIRLSEFLGQAYPLGLQYIPPQLVLGRDEERAAPYFANHLHTFDQVGILQRKMMDVAEHLEPLKENKEGAALIRQLFFAQDINRYLPGRIAGFTFLDDRLWTYAKLIDIETQLHKRNKIEGGQIRIAELLKNGTKSIIISNKALKVCIDHRNGGQVFEFDFRERALNLFAGYNADTHSPPRVIVAGKSFTSFIDHFLEQSCRRSDFISRLSGERDEFTQAQFDYKVKKTAKGAKAILSRQCAVSIDAKQYPLSVEKVFGLEGNESALSFVYQLANHSLTSYAFRFAIELTFTLPGAETHEAYLSCGERCFKDLAHGSFGLEGVTKWTLHDSRVGVSVHFVLQKPVDLWVFPARGSSGMRCGYQGTTLILSCPVSLGENAVRSLIGKMSCKKVKTKKALFNEI